MITVKFPDGATREYAEGTTGTTVVESISKSLAKATVAMRADGVLSDLSDLVHDGVTLEFIKRDDPAALELIRHDAAHVLAEASTCKPVLSMLCASLLCAECLKLRMMHHSVWTWCGKARLRNDDP